MGSGLLSFLFRLDRLQKGPGLVHICKNTPDISSASVLLLDDWPGMLSKSLMQ